MGREIKRVALDFVWPLNKVWKGYEGPEVRDCPENCAGGYSKTYRLLEEALSDFFFNHEGLKDPQYRQVTTFLAGREPDGLFGHDSIDRWTAIRKLGELAGLPEMWPECPVCHGHGNHPDDQFKADRWEPTEPPAGDGWQVWETVSEGSPISPVFATADECAAWVAEHEKCSIESARAFVAEGWAPSFVMDSKGFRSGIQALDGQDE